MTDHTPEPWEVGGPYPGVCVMKLIDAGSIHPECPEPPYYEAICIVDQRQKGEQNPQALADAQRIVDCVNACAGLTKEEIEEAVNDHKEFNKHAEYWVNRTPEQVERDDREFEPIKKRMVGRDIKKYYGINPAAVPKMLEALEWFLDSDLPSHRQRAKEALTLAKGGGDE